MSDSPHWGFVAAAYATAALTILGMILATLADFRAQSAALRRLEETRGSGGES
ncbi:heme exporter protein CcmD [Methylocapsa sp. S129]|uniref:heme exporter protein CcmD n=1 Tax=Methylocapsa sp. S129 TaxID=1641869 RepID=UPI00131C8DBF|nr:heme exporter protein CcmD [Methylocapsa sp. S129]